MADISMCRNKECPLHLKCYRFMAPINDLWQSYSAYTYNNGCDDYISIEGRRIREYNTKGE